MSIERKLRVWGGLIVWLDDKQHRTIVAARTKVRALEMLRQVSRGISRRYFDDYWSETGNETELATATTEGVWVNRELQHWTEQEFEKVR